MPGTHFSRHAGSWRLQRGTSSLQATADVQSNQSAHIAKDRLRIIHRWQGCTNMAMAVRFAWHEHKPHCNIHDSCMQHAMQVAQLARQSHRSPVQQVVHQLSRVLGVSCQPATQ
jgi:hypothetical protein